MEVEKPNQTSKKTSTRKKVTWHKCCVCQATSAKFKDRKFFRFPSDVERCKKWIKILKMIELYSAPLESLYKNYRICSIHFNDKAYATHKRKYLNKYALPIKTVDLQSIKILNVARMSETLRNKFQAALGSDGSKNSGDSSSNISIATEIFKLKKGGTSEQKNDDPNLLLTGDEIIIPDVEMQCKEMETQCIASTSFSNNSDIVFKQEIIETELEPCTFDDQSFRSSFIDGPSETQLDGQRPSTSYVTQSESLNSNADILPVGLADANVPTVSQGFRNVKDAPAVSSNSFSIISARNGASSSAPPILNVPDSESSMGGGSRKVAPLIIKIPRSESSPIIEQTWYGVSSRVGASSLPQDLNSSSHGRPCSRNELTQSPHSSPSFRLRDRFDVFGEFIAAKLRNLDSKSSAYVQATFADLIHKAELGMFSNIEDRYTSDARLEDIAKTTLSNASENIHGLTEKENIHPGIPSHASPHEPTNFIIGCESLSRDGTIEHRVSSHIANPPLTSVVNNTTAESTRPTFTSRVEKPPWPSGLSATVPESTFTCNPTQARTPSHTVPPSVLSNANCWSNTPIQTGVPLHVRPRDGFDTYGEFVASKLRNLDRRSRVFVQTAFADTIFKAELGRFANEGEQSFPANRTNDLGSQKNAASDFSSYEAQSGFDSMSSDFCEDQVPLEVIPNLHAVHQ